MVSKDKNPNVDSGELHALDGPPDDQGLSLDELSESFARLLGEGDDPYAEPTATGKERADGEDLESAAETPVDWLRDLGSDVDSDPNCPISPTTILEALLFVGHPNNEPLTSVHVASLMRGVRPREIDDLVRELNESYREQKCPYLIKSTGAGYQLVLRDDFHSIKDKFYGKVREARLSQAALDVLALVAYNQPISTEEVNKLRGKPSGSILNQMVRRELLSVERVEGSIRKKRFRTTDRFLSLFRLASIQDLPRTEEPEVR